MLDSYDRGYEQGYAARAKECHLLESTNADLLAALEAIIKGMEQDGSISLALQERACAAIFRARNEAENY